MSCSTELRSKQKTACWRVDWSSLHQETEGRKQKQAARVDRNSKAGTGQTANNQAHDVKINSKSEGPGTWRLREVYGDAVQAWSSGTMGTFYI